MCLIRRKRRYSARYPTAHHTYRIKHRNAKNCQAERYCTETITLKNIYRRVVLQDVEYHATHYRPKHERTAIADIHLGAATKYIMTEERNYCPYAYHHKAT